MIGTGTGTVGYVKLETRFIGVPIKIYRNDAQLMGTVPQPPPSISGELTVSLAGRQLHP